MMDPRQSSVDADYNEVENHYQHRALLGLNEVGSKQQDFTNTFRALSSYQEPSEQASIQMRAITSFTVVGGSNELLKMYVTVGSSLAALPSQDDQSQLMFGFPQVPSEDSIPSDVAQDQDHHATCLEALWRQDEQGPYHGFTSAHYMGGPQRISPAPSVNLSEPSDASASASTRSDQSILSVPSVRPTSSLPFTLASSMDQENLSPYQCLLREQIELFETSTESLAVKAQGRNNPIQVGQVGLRCRHCVPVMPSNQLESSAIQFSMTVNGVYQVAMKMGRSHFNSCRLMPDSIKKQLLELKELPHKRARGRKYWKETLEAQGLVEQGNRLRFMRYT